MLYIPDDQVSLGELTEEGIFEITDGIQYEKIIKFGIQIIILNVNSSCKNRITKIG